MCNVQKGKVTVQRSNRAGGFRTLVGYRLTGTSSTWLGGTLTEYSAAELADLSTVSLETVSDCSLGVGTWSPWFSIMVGDGTGWKTGEWSVTGTLQALS